MQFLSKTLLTCLTIMLTSCVVNKPISYLKEDIWPDENNQPFPFTVSIQMFEDNRMNMEENKILFNNPRQIKIADKQMCINAERHYKKDTVVEQLAKNLTQHLKYKKIFSNVDYDNKEKNQYYLTAQLNSFYAQQEFSNAAAIGQSFGLMGAIATAGIKTPGKIIIDISDIKLFDQEHNLVIDFGSYYKEYEEELRVDGACFSVFDNINLKLKEFNTFLIKKMQSELSAKQHELINN